MSAKQIIKVIMSKYPILYSRIYNIMKHNKVAIRSKEGNKVCYEGAFLNRCNIVVHGVGNEICIEEGVRLNRATIAINGNDNRICIGRMCSMTEMGCYIEDDNNGIEIGDGCTVSGKCNFSCADGTCISIGKDCMFSANIEIRTSDAHSIINSKGKRTNNSEDIVIADHCWIANTVIILKGTVIPKNSVVGAGSVVTGKFCDEGGIIVGNHAKVIKTGYTWLRERV